jgi:hypothetical protein
MMPTAALFGGALLMRKSLRILRASSKPHVLAFTVPLAELMAPLCQTECMKLSISCKPFMSNYRSGQTAVDEKRAAPRRRVLKTAFIVLSEKAPKLECAVRNISETGAMLQVSTTLGIPHSFDLIIEGEKHHCHSVWRTETSIGVEFKR